MGLLAAVLPAGRPPSDGLSGCPGHDSSCVASSDTAVEGVESSIDNGACGESSLEPTTVDAALAHRVLVRKLQQKGTRHECTPPSNATPEVPAAGGSLL